MDPLDLKGLVSSLLAAMGAAANDVSVRSGQRVVVAVSSPDSKELIGPHGEHLRALNMIAPPPCRKPAWRRSRGLSR